ncbi:MAG TPA: glycoside hydrolase family 3 C-terminal domain-containing protein [Roseiarcus sp.]|nr:glycoside hydrolase family 3 C-terminal domain-containing protein [Roseiarcus sp.]
MAGRSRIIPALAGLAVAASAAAAGEPCGDRNGGSSTRAEATLQRMTQSEKLSLVDGSLGAHWGGHPKPEGAIGSAGYVPGIPRLGIPALQETDGELGVANPGNIRPGATATAMPSDLALASTWDLPLARRQGEAVGAEARAAGFNVLLGGAANLIRDPRGGRSFEYFSEDPLVTGLMAGAAIAGVQSRHIISTTKHFALDDQETDRVVLDVRIDPAAARESDLLAFEIDIERSHPGSVMCAYNLVNGVYSCQNDWLLTQVLKNDWRYPGYVMSDWGAVHSTVRSALAGLDQESGEQLDTQNFFGPPLALAIKEGKVPEARLDDMVRRILTSIYACGLVGNASASDPADIRQGDAAALEIEREGAVLLRNEGMLPLAADTARILVVGAHADRGVPSGGGSSQVIPTGGIALKQPEGKNRAMIFDPSSPLEAIRRQFPRTRVDYNDGASPLEAAKAAAGADAVLVFADQYMTEGLDVPNLNLPNGQDELIETVARANRRTVVVLETGGPVVMPWLDSTAAVIEAWYPGQKGGEAIADVLSGEVNPSGRLTVTFPASEAQLPQLHIQGNPSGAPTGPVGRSGHYGRIFTADYTEGAIVGYKWFFVHDERPLFPFGYGLSYTTFGLRGLKVSVDGDRVTASVTVRNLGSRAGAAVPQLYLSRPQGDGIPLRLAGWSRIDLAPGEEREATISVDPRLLATFDEAARRWRIAAGAYRMTAGFDADHRDLAASFALDAAELPP